MKKQFKLYAFKKFPFSKKLALESLKRLEKQGVLELKWIKGKLYYREVENETVQTAIDKTLQKA